LSLRVSGPMDFKSGEESLQEVRIVRLVRTEVTNKSFLIWTKMLSFIFSSVILIPL